MVSLLTFQLHNSGVLEPVENSILDTLIKLNPLPPKDLYVVSITTADYQKLFAGQSPLNPKKLSELINAILVGEPKVLVVDVNTTDPRFRDLKLHDNPANVVWSRAAAPWTGSPATENKTDEVPTFQAKPLLGSADSKSVLWGAAVMPTDPDGIVRRYCEYVRIRETEQGAAQPVPTLSFAAARIYKPSIETDQEPAFQPMILSSLGGERDIPQIAASDLLSIYSGAGWKESVNGKIVLLGGNYSTDDHVTASGTIPGVAVHAAAIESILHRPRLVPVNSSLLLCVEVITGFAVAILNYFFGIRKTVIAGWIAFPLVLASLSPVNLSWLYLWIDLVPVLLSVSFLQVYRPPRDITGPANDDKTRVGVKNDITQDLSSAPPEPVYKLLCPACGTDFPDGPMTKCPDDETNLSRIRVNELLVGTTFEDKYEITSLLGQGGMSTVYRARHMLLKTEVAIKVLRKHLASDKQCVMRFYQEAKATSLISHQNVIRVQDFGVNTISGPYLILDYIEGSSLADTIARDGHMEVHHAVRLFLQLCDGLACAHSHGILHRDLKPSNIMLIQQNANVEPLVKILDFGIAKIASNDLRLTATGDVIGSPVYMSPEQCTGTQLDHRSDIYALGCIMYECLTGLPPFDSKHAMEILRMHMQTPPPPLPDWCTVSPWLSEIVFRALSKVPDDRFSTVVELKSNLEAGFQQANSSG